MSRIQPVNRNANAKTQEMLNAIEKKLGKVPNMMSTMGQSPAVLSGYLNFSGALAAGSLSANLRDQIALAVSEMNHCEYCLAAHSFLGAKGGLSESDIMDARHGAAANAKDNAALVFAQKIVEQRGHVSDDDFEQVREAGYTDSQIAEIIANVALSTFTNYFNVVTGAETDFPAARCHAPLEMSYLLRH